MKSIWFVGLCLVALSGADGIFAADYYVAQKDPAASDTNPGTEQQPFKTLSNACTTAQAGDTVYIKEGTYREALIPKHSGEKGKPITFQAYKKDFVMIKGSEVLTGLEREGTNLWVKRPWTKEGWWSDALCRGISAAPYQDSARIDQVFVNETPLQWVPSRKELKPGCFYWNAKKEKKSEPADGELVICPPEGVADLNQALVEIPVLNNVVGAWLGDPLGLGGIRRTRQYHPDNPISKQTWPEIHYIHIKGLHFRHAAHTLNRVGVRLDGDYWLLENCTVEYMNCNGVSAGADHGIVRNCMVSHNGQSGLDCGSGSDNLFENCVTFYNNRKIFSIGWGGAGNKLCVVNHNTVRGLVSAFNYGSGLWYDIDCRNVLVEDCLVFGNRPINAGYFYEISWDGIFRRNIAFANHAAGETFYGAECVLSSSASTLVEDNVLIGGTGGVSLGGGRSGRKDALLRPDMTVWTAISNSVRGNLIVEPSDYVFCVMRNEMYDSTLPQAGNRFQDNTILAKYGAGRVFFGNETFDNLQIFEQKNSLAQNNRQVTELAQLKRKDRSRLDEAFNKILNVLVLADPRLDLKSSRVNMEQIWVLEAETRSIGYWVKSGEQYYLLLDMPWPGTVQVLDAGAKEVVLWDFPVLKPPVRTVLPGINGVFSGHAQGPFALMTGLGKEAHALSEIFDVSARVKGAVIKAIPEGQGFEVRVVMKNPFARALDYMVSGPGLGGKWSLTLPAQGVAETNLAMVASASQEPLVYEVSISQMPTNRRTVRLTVEKPAMAPYLRELTVDPQSDRENSHVGLTPIMLDRESQRAKGLYDLRTGKGWNGLEDLSGSVWCGWNEKALYIQAQIRDNKVVPQHGAPYERDCLEVFLDGRGKQVGNRIYTHGAYQFFLEAPDPAKSGWQTLKWNGRATNGVSGRCRLTPMGYELEAAVSWDLFPEMKPGTGVMMGVDFALDDADYDDGNGQPIRTTQLIWHGTGDNYRDASLFGLVKLEPAAEVDFGEPIQAGDIVTRDGNGVLAIYREKNGNKPLRTIPLRIEGRYASSFVGGSICFDADRNFYFLDGSMNMRLQVLPAGETRSRILHEFPHPDEKENPYCFGANLISVGKDRLLVMLSRGGIVDFSPAKKDIIQEKSIFSACRGAGMSLSPDGSLLAIASGEPNEGLALVRVTDLAMTNLPTSSGLLARPASVAFVPAEKPFLAVVNGFTPMDDPAIASAVPWKDGGTEVFRVSTNSRLHVLRLDYDPAIFQLGPPPVSNLKDGKSFSLVANRTADGHLWKSSFDAITVDTKQKRVLVSSRTLKEDGMNLYAAPLDTFIKGGLTLDDFAPIAGNSSCIVGLAIAP